MRFSSDDTFSVKHSLIPPVELSLPLRGSLKALWCYITAVLRRLYCASGPLGILLKCRFRISSFGMELRFCMSNKLSGGCPCWCWILELLQGAGLLQFLLRYRICHHSALCWSHCKHNFLLIKTALFQSRLLVIPISHILPSLVFCWQFWWKI